MSVYHYFWQCCSQFPFWDHRFQPAAYRSLFWGVHLQSPISHSNPWFSRSPFARHRGGFACFWDHSCGHQLIFGCPRFSTRILINQNLMPSVFLGGHQLHALSDHWSPWVYWFLSSYRLSVPWGIQFPFQARQPYLSSLGFNLISWSSRHSISKFHSAFPRAHALISVTHLKSPCST